MPQIIKEQDKAFAAFTSFLKNVIEKSSELHKATDYDKKDKALENLAKILFENFNFQKILTDKEIQKIKQSLTN
tara:strand:+ start:182 stop:403 length:222 start_codon:yes stop_codon:yes gene_type:complete